MTLIKRNHKKEIKEHLPKTKREKAIEGAKESAITHKREVKLFFDGKKYTK